MQFLKKDWIKERGEYVFLQIYLKSITLQNWSQLTLEFGMHNLKKFSIVVQQRANNNNKKGVSNLKLERGRIQFYKRNTISWESLVSENFS